MDLRAYSRWNTIIGWIVFAVAALTYLATIEWTVSLWDCGEFVSASYKLQVCHPPGAPMFLLINRVFTMLAATPQMVPIIVNASSALASAFTILFLFWSITALAYKMLAKEGGLDRGSALAIFGSGIIGALAYTWSDTAWFSAVEGEVYALSSMFTALIFWLALKWEVRANEKFNLRWMVLIFYMIGVVIGVHLLGLLVIPVIVIMYYFRLYKPTVKGTIIAFLIGVVSLAVVQYGIIQYLLKIGAKFDLLFVNDFGLPLWSGVIFFFTLVFAALTYGIWWTHKNGKVFFNLGLLCFAVTTIGYLSYAITVIRSYDNPPIDMNDPEDAFSVVSYLAREQYGDNYLGQGPYYPAFRYRESFEVSEGAMQYRRATKPDGSKEFVETGPKVERKFIGKYSTIFPRLYSPQDNHIQGYRYWVGIKRKVDPMTGREIWEDEDPSFKFSFTKHNLNFFFRYQINYMYWRYFAWNFIGRQNDMQGTQGEFHQGNWATGIGFIDKALGNGPQDNLPGYMRDNKARNSLFALPFILGLLGMALQYKNHKKDFFVVFLFFFMTGLAIEIYLNMPNPQPRERDYAFVGSFYVFAIWIGLGVLYLWDALRKRMPSPTAAMVTTAVALVLVPGIMVAQEWDDHDRSNRYTSLDYGVDYLESCAPNAVLFCNGDNDTYPLWYAQEVEGIRDDIRIINLSLLSTDWYVDEMRKPINKANALTFSLTPEQTVGWDYLSYEQQLVEGTDQAAHMPIADFIKHIGDPSKRVDYGGDKLPYMPTQKLRLTIPASVKQDKAFAKYASIIPDHIDFDLQRGSLLKSDVMVLDFIQTNNWKLPIYFSITSGPNEYLNLGKYLQQEGLAYRLVPYINPAGAMDGQEPRIETDVMYANVMKKFKFGGLSEGDKLVDFVTGRQCNNMRGVFARLARNLAIQGKKKEAVEVIERSIKEIPESAVPLDFYSVQLADAFYRTGEMEKANKFSNRLADVMIEELDFYSRCPKQLQRNDVPYEIRRGLYGLQTLQNLATEYNQTALLNKVKPKFEEYRNKLNVSNEEL